MTPPRSRPGGEPQGLGDAATLISLRWWIGGALAAALVFIGILGVELNSLQRANRIFRDGDYVAAADAYRELAAREDSTRRASYNLGTSLLRAGSDDLETMERLAIAIASPDSSVGSRANYNLGYRMLVGALAEPERDSALVRTRLAVELNLEALRLDPRSSDARWNLAIAQRTFDSLVWIASRPEESFSPDSMRTREDEDVTATALRRLQDRSGSLGGHFFSRGEKEALARDLGEDALSASEAASMMARMARPPEYVLRRIFLMQSPNRWGSRGGSRRVW